MLNDRVSPPIEIRWEPTTSMSRYSVNRYYDPLDQGAWDENDLTPLERGHVYLYRQDGDVVYIHTPYRIVDMEACYLLQRYRSFWAIDPAIIKSSRGKNLSSDASRTRPNAALRHFRLSAADFATFRVNASAIGWVVEQDRVDTEVLLGNISRKLEEVGLIQGQLDVFRSTWCAPPGASSETELREVTAAVAACRETLKSAQEVRLLFARQLDRLSREPDRRADYVVVEGELERLGNAITAAGQLPLDRYEREAVHLFRVNMGLESIGSTGHIRPLTQELADLVKHHPQLRVLSVSGDSLLVTIDTLVIRVTATGLSVTGDPAVLGKYMGASEAGSDPTVSNRFRAVVATEPAPEE